MLIKHLKQGTQATEPIGLIRAIWMIRVLKKISSLCLKEHEYSESRMLIKLQARSASRSKAHRAQKSALCAIRVRHNKRQRQSLP